MNYNTFNKLSYGLYIVTSKAGEKLNGFVSNTITQVASEPPTFSVSCSKNNATAGIIQNSGVFAVSILHEDTSIALIKKFGYETGSEINKFEQVNYWFKGTGAPILLDGTAAYIDCRVTQTFDLGSHWLFIGQAESAEIIDNQASLLGYTAYREKYGLDAPVNSPTYVAPEKANPELQKEDKYHCIVCGYDYRASLGDAKGGIPAGTSLYDLPGHWKCPLCGAGQEDFRVIRAK